MSGPIISQVNRKDPALLQYAIKAFGTTQLSEENWQKAEDHYKVDYVPRNVRLLSSRILTKIYAV